MNMSDFNEQLSKAFSQLNGTGEGRKRPYNGQAQTHHGLRGMQKVDVTMRDLCDALHEAWKFATFPGDPEPDVDVEALAQNICVEVEKMMGIYPNVPPLELINIPIIEMPDD